MSFRLTAFHYQCQWTRIFLSFTTPMTIRTQFGFKRHWKSHCSSQCSRELRFWYYYQWIFLQIALPLWVLEVHMDSITGVTIHITESKIQNLGFSCCSSIIFTCHPFPTLVHIIAKRTIKPHRKCRYSSQPPEKLLILYQCRPFAAIFTNHYMHLRFGGRNSCK